MELKEYHERFEDYRQNELIRLQKLYNYYDRKYDILHKKNRTSNKADAKVVSGYASYISTIATAYFLGKPISYKADEGLMGYDRLNEYLATEEEQKTNFELALNASIFGKSYELLYIDNARELKSKCLDTRDVFVIKDNTIDKNIIGAVRFGTNKIKTDEIEVTLEVYDSKNSNGLQIQIQKIFTRNLPRNLKEISEIMKNLKGLVSDETLISLFPQVEDVKTEMEKMKSEAEENNIYKDYNIAGGNNEPKE